MKGEVRTQKEEQSYAQFDVRDSGGQHHQRDYPVPLDDHVLSVTRRSSTLQSSGLRPIGLQGRAG